MSCKPAWSACASELAAWPPAVQPSARLSAQGSLVNRSKTQLCFPIIFIKAAIAMWITVAANVNASRKRCHRHRTVWASATRRPLKESCGSAGNNGKSANSGTTPELIFFLSSTKFGISISIVAFAKLTSHCPYCSHCLSFIYLW